MTPTEYRVLRESIGSQTKVARVLDCCTAVIAKRENGTLRIGRQAEFAIRWAVQQESTTPTAKVTRVTPHYGPKRKR